MPFVVFLYQYRKDGITPKEFQDSMEGEIYPWLANYIGIHNPVAFTRHYPARVNGEIGRRFAALQALPPALDKDATVVLIGDAAEFPWDVMIRVEFRDELHFQQYFAFINEPEHADKIAEQEEKNSDPSKLRIEVIGDVFY
jgi:hypothetical protein